MGPAADSLIWPIDWCFKGTKENESWEIKFLGYFRTQKLYNTITAGIDGEINPNKNAEAFVELV